MTENLSERLAYAQPAVVEPLRRMLFFLAPHDPLGMELRRYGKDHDGGYVMLEDWPEEGAAYSIGIMDDVSWDAAMAAKGYPVHMYDHTIAGLPHEHENFHWSPIGLGETDRPEENLLSLATLLERNGHLGCRDLILKMDVEGAEWAALLHLPDRFLEHFRQILVEFHDCSRLDDAEHAQTMLRVFSLLNVSHRVVHIHANNWSSYDLVGGIPFPSVLEVSYVRQDVCTTVPSKRTFPTSLDMPNDANRPDYALPFWGAALSDRQMAESRALQAEFRLEELREASRREIEEIRDTAWQAKDEALQAHREAERLREHIQVIHHSSSWRITRPLRGLKRLATGDFSPLARIGGAARRFFFRSLELWGARAGPAPKTFSPHAERMDKWLQFAARHPRQFPVRPAPAEGRAARGLPAGTEQISDIDNSTR